MKRIVAYKNIECIFDEEKHSMTINGERNYFNVTGITGIIDKSPFLIPWAVKLAVEHLSGKYNDSNALSIQDFKDAADQHRIKKEKAGSIGSMVHEFAEHWSLGLKPKMPDDERARNGALAFLKWLDSEKIKINHPEEVLYSKKHGYWGIKDSDGSRKGENLVIDYKTSKGMYPEFRLQVSSYLFAAQEMLGRKYSGYYIVKFDKDEGNFEPLYVPLSEAKKDFDAFLSALELKKRLKEITPKYVPKTK